jgi:hypothetical protein
MVERGFDLASRIPDVNPSFTILQSEAIGKAQGAFSLLNVIGNWLPVIMLILLALGVYVAKGHRRALVGAGLGLAVGMVALALGILFFRTIYLNALPLGVFDREAAAAFFDTLVRFLRLGLRTVLVFGLVVALAGFFTGRSVTAVRARAGLKSGIGWLRGGAESAGFRTGPVGAWIYTYKRVLWIAVIAIAALVLVFLGSADREGDRWDTLAVLVVLVIIEFLGRPPSPLLQSRPSRKLRSLLDRHTPQLRCTHTSWTAVIGAGVAPRAKIVTTSRKRVLGHGRSVAQRTGTAR